jgi:DNA-binding IclR family transcriptional regulator
MADEDGTESARRVADILIAVSEARGPVGVNELARRTAMSPTVAHRILRALVSRFLVEQDPETSQYSVGSAAILFGGQAIAHTNLRDVARPTLDRLMRQTGQTATLSALAGTRRSYLDQVLPDAEMKFSVELGQPYSLRIGSSGRVMLAHLASGVVRSILETPVPAEHGPEAAVDTDDLLRRLDEVRKRGVAISHGERISGAAGVAAVIHGPHANVVGAVNIVGPTSQFTDAALPGFIRSTQEAAAAIERDLRDASLPQRSRA